METPTVTANIAPNYKAAAFLISFLTSLGIVLGSWITVKTTLQDHQTRIQNFEYQSSKTDAKLDKIMDKLEVIQIDMANKQDRK